MLIFNYIESATGDFLSKKVLLWISQKLIAFTKLLRFYQGFSKTMNDNIFCTKIKLLTQNTVLKVSLLRFLLVQTPVKLRNSHIHGNC